jgi:hypothetical protein
MTLSTEDHVMLVADAYNIHWVRRSPWPGFVTR